MGAHRLHGAVRVAGAEGGDDRPVVFLVQLPPLAGGAAPLEVAPDLPVPGRLHDAVQRGEQRAVRGGDDAPVQGQVPGLELLVAGRLVAAGDAALHLREVPGGRPQDDKRQRLRLDEAADRHHVGRGEVRGAGTVAEPAGPPSWPLPPARPLAGGRAGARRGQRAGCRLAQERAPADLAGDQAVGLQGREREPDPGARNAQVGGEPALGGQPGTRQQARPPGFGQDQLRELASPLRGHGWRGPRHCLITIHPAWRRLSHAAPVRGARGREAGGQSQPILPIIVRVVTFI